MAVSSTIRRNHHVNWNGFMDINIVFDITGTINDAFNLLTVTIKVVSASYNGSSHSGGSGFINIGGIAWILPETGRAFDRNNLALYDWDTSYNQLKSIYPGLNPSFDNRIIWGYGASDDAQPPAVERFLGIGVGQSKTFTRTLTPADFDAEGNLVNIKLVSGFTRYINNSGGQIVDPAYPFDYVICQTNATFDLSFDDFDFFPWAIRKSGSSWKSCNRPGGSLKIRKGGVGRDVKNTISPSGTANKGRIRKSGVWVTSPITGEDG